MTSKLAFSSGKPWLVVGVVDSYGAVHCEVVRDGCRMIYHEELWPQHQKRWRFIVREWQIDTSVLSLANLTPEDCDAILRKVGKLVEAPEWVRKGDAWEAAGRPHGEAGERFNDTWEAQEAKRRARMNKKNQK